MNFSWIPEYSFLENFAPDVKYHQLTDLLQDILQLSQTNCFILVRKVVKKKAKESSVFHENLTADPNLLTVLQAMID